MTAAREQALLSMAVSERSLAVQGRYTSPPSWGVYRIEPDKRSASRRFRIGNHPVREQELHKQFGSVQVIALFTSRELAVELAVLCNVDRR